MLSDRSVSQYDIASAELDRRKPKNARVKRALEAREPKLVENEKTAIFVKGQNTSERVRTAMKDLVSSRMYAEAVRLP